MQRSLFGYAVMGVMSWVLAIGMHSGSYHVYEAAAEEIEVEEVIPVEEPIRWDEERIIEEIRRVFPEAPIMVEVARCESRFKADAEGPTNDGGVFQIHRPSHHARIEGMDLYDPVENIRFARVLYEERGLRPWYASRHCWSEHL